VESKAGAFKQADRRPVWLLDLGQKPASVTLRSKRGRERDEPRGYTKAAVSNPDVEVVDPVTFHARRYSHASYTDSPQLRQEVKVPAICESDGVAAVMGNRVVAEPLFSFRDTDLVSKAARKEGPHNPTVRAQTLECQKSRGDLVPEPCQPAIGPFGQGTGPGPSPRDGHQPPQHLVWLCDLSAAGLRVTLRDEPPSGPAILYCDYTVADQLATMVEENDISYLKARRGGRLHHDLIPVPQLRGHAPTGHPELERLAVEEEVAEAQAGGGKLFQEVCQIEAIAPDCLANFRLTV
jgi:hypothetical protein